MEDKRIIVAYRDIEGNRYLCVVFVATGQILYRQIPAERDDRFEQELERYISKGCVLV